MGCHPRRPAFLCRPCASCCLTSSPVRRARTRRGRREPAPDGCSQSGAAAAVVILAGAGVAAWQVNSSPAANDATRSIAACANTPTCHTISLAAAGRHDRATVLVNGDLVSVAPAAAMPAAGTGSMYVLWQMTRDSSPKALGSFQVTGASITSAMPLASSYSDTVAFAISSEPAGPLPSVPRRSSPPAPRPSAQARAAAAAGSTRTTPARWLSGTGTYSTSRPVCGATSIMPLPA